MGQCSSKEEKLLLHDISKLVERSKFVWSLRFGDPGYNTAQKEILDVYQATDVFNRYNDFMWRNTDDIRISKVNKFKSLEYEMARLQDFKQILFYREREYKQ